MESSAIYGLESQGRALCSQSSEVDSVRFFVGTLSTRSGGQVHQIDFDEETNVINRKVFKPKVGEIWQIQCCPWAVNTIALCYNEITDFSAQMKGGLWSLPAVENPEDTELTLKCKLQSEETVALSEYKCIDCHPTRIGRITSILESGFLVWDINDGPPKILSHFETERVYSGKWNPHLDGNQISLLSGSHVKAIDTRSMKEAWTCNAHKFQVRDIDFNPNKQYYFASCGDDCTARFWDFRKPTESLKELQCHSHWVWRVRYNTFHDQLVLTAGSDSRVVLHSLPTISSEPKGHVVFSDSEEDDKEKVVAPKLEEGVLAKYEEHEDAVYVVEWSNCDPWVFASLSYDGRLVINRVPKSQKYKIIL